MKLSNELPKKRKDKATIEKENKRLAKRIEGLEEEIELNKACENEEEVRNEIDTYRQELIRKQTEANLRRNSKK